MTKAQKKTAAETSTAANRLAAEFEAGREQIAQSTPPTPESITDRISEGVDALALAFVEPELKVRADNGKLYRLTKDGEPLAPDGVDMLAIEEVNALAFMQRQIASVVCWKLETMVEDNAAKQGDTERQLAWAKREVDKGRQDQSLVDSKQRFLSDLQYQAAMLTVAFDAACNAYAANIGEPFLTRAEREAEKIKARRARNERRPASETAQDERLARFAA